MKIKILIFALLGLMMMNTGYAQNEAFFLGTVSGVGGRALSMGSAYIAIADDYSATMWNPAGLTQLRRMELFTSLSHLQYSNNASAGELGSNDETSKTKLNSIGFAFPIPTYRGSMVFAVGYNKVRSFDGGFNFGGFNSTDTIQAQQSFNEIESGGMANWVFSGAVQVTPHLSVGATLNLWRGQDDYIWSYNEEDILNHYYFDYYNFDQEIQTKFSATNS